MGLKVCKGIGKAKGFKGCGIETSNRHYGLCPKCYFEWMTTTKDGKTQYEKLRIKAKNKARKEINKRHKEEREKLIDYKTKLQTEINRIVRSIDRGLNCLARNTRGQMHAGHVYSRGSNPTIKFNLHNIHRQSAMSNHYQNDDGLLREGIEREYGDYYMSFISSLRRTPALKYSNEEYKEFYLMAKEILKELKKDETKVFSKEQRIKLRNKINLKLGIYPKEFCIFVL